MPNYRAIRNFLSLHHGYYCEACLATRLDLPADEIRRSARQRAPAEVTIAYRLCQSCLDEKGVFALRTCA
jgi:hypothetical protein